MPSCEIFNNTTLNARPRLSIRSHTRPDTINKRIDQIRFWDCINMKRGLDYLPSIFIAEEMNRIYNAYNIYCELNLTYIICEMNKWVARCWLPPCWTNIEEHRIFSVQLLRLMVNYVLRFNAMKIIFLF